VSATRRAVLQRRLRQHRADVVATQYLQDTGEKELWRISVRVPAGEEVDYGKFLERLRGHVEPVLEAAAADGITDVHAEYCGGVPLVHKAQSQLLQDLIKSFLLAFGLIGITMAVLLRSAAAGAVSMIPNLLPAAVVFGIMGSTGVGVEIGAVMTASAALGIAVDDTLHFVTWFRRSVATGHSRQRAVRHAYARCGTAMLQTSLICGLGLLMFALSEFTPVCRFAWLMFSLLMAALVGDLIVLPAILVSPLGRSFCPSRRGGSVPDVPPSEAADAKRTEAAVFSDEYAQPVQEAKAESPL
jgi:predicted RND superfamily exporter protein